MSELHPSKVTKPPIIGECRLCKKTARLQNSHIIPEFFYSHCYDKKGRTMMLPMKKKKAEIAQKGFRAKLLCAACEGFLNKNYENPYFQFWSQCTKIKTPINDNVIVLDGFDYGVFKLLHLSIIWRFMVSGVGIDMKPAWENIISKDAEILRQMLLSGNPGDSRSYSISGVCVVVPETRLCMRGFVLPPSFNIHEGYLLSSMTYDGFGWIIYHAPDSFPGMKRFALKRHGEIHCRVIESPRYVPLLQSLSKMHPELLDNTSKYASRTK